MTDQQVVDYARSLINEPTAKFWTDPEITLYKTIAIELVFGQFWHLMVEKKQDYASVSLQAGVSDLVFPTGAETLDDYVIVKVEVASTGEELDYIESNQIHEWGNYPYNYPCVWTYKGGKIHVLPAPVSNETDWLRVWYLKKTKTIAELPAVLHPLVAVEMILSAKTKDEDVSNDLLVMQRRFTETAIHALSLSQVQDTGSLEDSEGDEGIY